jgi:chorismate mutase / prephenate dehydrogenase
VAGDRKSEPVGSIALRPLRQQLDALDGEVLELLARRMQVVEQIALVKRAQGLGVRDFERERQVLDERCQWARALGLPPEPVESIYRQIMLASRNQQRVLGAGRPLKVSPKRVAVIGGLGQMGKLLERFFRELGHQVQIADLGTQVTPEQAAADADVCVISVPIAHTIEVIERLGPLVREEALLMDVTSVKQAPLEAMLRCSHGSVAGTHPMFGPGVHTLEGQRVVLCRARGDAWNDWLADTLQARGLVVTLADAAEHDRAMALVQVLTHFQTQVLGWALARSGVPLAESRRFTSPAYLMEAYVTARHFAQDPGLYGPIEMQNPGTPRVTGEFQRAARELSEILATRDQARFNAMFHEVRAYFGDFSVEAQEQSSFLIDRLVERTLG